jgi:hypothetical protein
MTNFFLEMDLAGEIFCHAIMLSFDRGASAFSRSKIYAKYYCVNGAEFGKHY